MRLSRWLLPLTLMSVTLGCGPSDSGPKPSPEATPLATSAPPSLAAPTASPTALSGAESTAATSNGDPQRGAPLYATYCSSCHGPHGDGDGPAAAALQPRPAKHSDKPYMQALSDEHLFKVIKLGGTAAGKSPLMAPWGGALSDQQIHDLVAFVRTLAQ